MKSVLITGVAGGIGTAIATRFKQAGWRILGVDRIESSRVEGLGSFLQGDVTNTDFWGRDIPRWLGNEAPIHALVNNAAIQLCKPLMETAPEEWDHVMAVNLKAAFLSVKALVPLMAKEHGVIVNVASVHAIATTKNIGAYAASKGGLVALTRAAALELAEQNIRVNAVLPGAVDTPMLESGLARSGSSDDISVVKQQLASRTPLGRIGHPAEIADAVFFLADENTASFISGQTLVVDGGALSRLSTE